MKAITPLMKQYNEIKNKFPNSIVLFKVGDFYEIFGKDARKCSKVLNIVLTKRHKKSDIELAGFPHHSINNYLPKLIKAGFKIAICDELEKTENKVILKRGVTEIITPGVVTNSEVLDAKNNNFLGAIYYQKNSQKLGISFLDISTGEFLVGEGDQNYINQMINKFLPKEIIYPKQKKNYIKYILNNKIQLQSLEDCFFSFNYAYKNLIQHFQTNSLKGFNIHKLFLGITSAGAILAYVCNICNYKINHITSIKRIDLEKYLNIENFSFENLEILTSKNEDAVTLLKILDFTYTPMGSRLINKWLRFPLKNIKKIKSRQKILSEFLKNKKIVKPIIKKLKQIADLERLIAKIVNLKATPYDLLILKKTLKNIIDIKGILLDSKSKSLKQLAKKILNCNKIYRVLEKVLFADAPKTLNKGKVIKPGISKELDKLRNVVTNSENTIFKICERERKDTGIKNLKINYNNIFGYYIELKKTFKRKIKIPKNWKRKQILANVERYITEELKNSELKIKLAKANLSQIEQKILADLINFVIEEIDKTQHNSKLIAKIDVILSLVRCAKTYNYICPKFNKSFNLYIKGGRHPVIEFKINSNSNELTYVSNDIFLTREKKQIFIITGPNMAGKSAILRQTALIILMAQLGSYIPAKYAEIGIIEQIFIRVGASDNISIGESTFMREMNETASILNNISERSLILLDEIGRGTSTYDGISIAWAIIEFLHNHPKKPLVLFATHYHELNNMISYYKRIINLSLSVKKINNTLIYTRKLLPYGCQNSYGINVAQLAGIPNILIKRAKKILSLFEKLKSFETIKLYRNYKIIKNFFCNLKLKQLTLAASITILKKIKFFFQSARIA
ncbi:DNA mismatch repair protein MutS [Candidatus Karelsulcia muelleri]|uniref:DNA mismatch repair protein MutS n=1 Tax=Candidatus Karelsulcia muelleri TaxID=336810 RepID=UPI001EF1D5DC|nr:DNA mismatch repair protein MutS [Candidatus Karelsulcia muelleri]